jgi:hypothetical protein
MLSHKTDSILLDAWVVWLSAGAIPKPTALTNLPLYWRSRLSLTYGAGRKACSTLLAGSTEFKVAVQANLTFVRTFCLRRIAKPVAPMPSIIIAQVALSGTVVTATPFI